MRISSLWVERFGRFEGFGLALGDGLNVVYGPNGSGKTTLHRFLEGMLLGFCGGDGLPLPRYRTYLPGGGGGELTLRLDGLDRPLRRRVDPLEPSGEASVVPEALSSLIPSRERFLLVHSVDQDSLASPELIPRLLELAGGLDLRPLGLDVFSLRLEVERRDLELEVLERALLDRIEETEVRIALLSRAREELRSLEEELEGLDAQLELSLEELGKSGRADLVRLALELGEELSALALAERGLRARALELGFDPGRDRASAERALDLAKRSSLALPLRDLLSRVKAELSDLASGHEELKELRFRLGSALEEGARLEALVEGLSGAFPEALGAQVSSLESAWRSLEGKLLGRGRLEGLSSAKRAFEGVVEGMREGLKKEELLLEASARGRRWLFLALLGGGLSALGVYLTNPLLLGGAAVAVALGLWSWFSSLSEEKASLKGRRAMLFDLERVLEAIRGLEEEMARLSEEVYGGSPDPEGSLDLLLALAGRRLREEAEGRLSKLRSSWEGALGGRSFGELRLELARRGGELSGSIEGLKFAASGLEGISAGLPPDGSEGLSPSGLEECEGVLRDLLWAMARREQLKKTLSLMGLGREDFRSFRSPKGQVRAREGLLELLRRREEVLLRMGELSRMAFALDPAREALEELKADLFLLRRERAKLKTASLLLEEGLRRFDDLRSSKALDLASEVLSRLSSGLYRRIRPLRAGRRSLGVEDSEGRWWEVEGLSRGFVEQLHLSLRVALCCEDGLPLLVDDALSGLDGERALSALEVLSGMPFQTILFTSRWELAEVAFSMGARAFRLGG